jgi:adenine-specific DNA-methyltransferase
VLLPRGFPSEVEKITFPQSKISNKFFNRCQEYNYIPRELTQEFDVHYPILKDSMLIDNFNLITPCRVYSGWGNLNKLQKFIDNNCVPIKDGEGDFSFYVSKKGVVTYKKQRKKPRNILSVIRDVGTTTQSKNQLEDMGIDFDYPKPVSLISYLIKMSTKTNSIVLDSFAGSGTTGEAVLRLNKEDGNNRKFILIELEPPICKISQQRLKKVVQGYVGKRTQKRIAGIGGEFQYSILDKTLFDKNGRIEKSCTFEDLATYIYFTETKMILDKKRIAKNFIGEHLDTKYYLIFRGIGKNTLTRSLLRELLDDSRKVIYGDNCTVSEDELAKYNTTFKQIPYEVRIF